MTYPPHEPEFDMHTLTPAQQQRLEEIADRDPDARVTGWDDEIGGPTIRLSDLVLDPRGRLALGPSEGRP